jgi:secreted trypsin-like serine protease
MTVSLNTASLRYKRNYVILTMNRFVILLACTLSPFLQSLVHRHDVSDEHLVALAKPYNQICHFSNGEGTLIADRWVLTAGHVAVLYKNTNDPKKQLILINNQPYQIEKVILHPNFSNFDAEGGLKNDIALVKIKEPVRDISPAKLYANKDEKDKLITLVGAGDIGTGLTGATKNDHITRAVTNRVDDVTDSWIMFTFDPPNSRNATPYEGVSGPGDSGGPAFLKANNVVYIVGISSNQAITVDEKGNSTQPGHYGIMERYTRVSSYFEWISKIIEK